MAIKVPIVTEFNKAGLTDAERALSRFGVKSTKDLAAAAAGFGILAGAGAAAFSSMDRGFDQIVVGTGATGAALDALKEDAKAVAREVPNSFEDVGAAVAEVNTRFELTGPALQDMTKRFLDLSRVTGTDVKQNIADVSRVFGDWSIATEDQAASLDMLFAASQQTGIGVDRLSNLVVQFGAPMRQLGFEFEEAVAIFGKFEKEGVNVEAIMSGLRMGLGRMAKAGEEPVETFQRLIEEIQNAGSAGEANAIALDAFGQRAGPDMAAAIREGRFEIDDLVTALGNSEGALATAAEETLSAQDRFKMLTNQLMVAATPAIELFAEVVEVAVGALAKLPGPVQSAVVAIGALAIASGSARKAMQAFGRDVVLARTSIGSLAAPLAAAGAAMVGFGLHAAKAADETRRATEATQDLERATDAQLIDEFGEALGKIAIAGKGLEGGLAEIAKLSPGAIARLIEMEDASGALTARLTETGMSAENAAEMVDGLRQALVAEKAAQDAARESQEAATEALGAGTESADGLASSLGELEDAEDNVRTSTDRRRQAQEAATTRAEELRRATEDLTDANVGLVGSEISVERATYRFQDAQGALQEQIDEGSTPGTRAYDEALTDAKDAALQMARASADQEIATREAAGETLSATEKADVFGRHLGNLTQFSIPAIRTELDNYKGKLDAIPADVVSVVHAEIDNESIAAAVAALDDAARDRWVRYQGTISNLVSSGQISHTGSRRGAGETVETIPGQLFTPDVPGRIHSPAESARMLADGGGGSVVVHQHFNVTVQAGLGVDYVRGGKQVAEVLATHTRQNGPAWLERLLAGETA